MADWRAIRKSARRQREALGLPASELMPAADVIALAIASTGLSTTALPPKDPLLANAHAVLDRELRTIWHRNDLSSEITQFNLAHELAHWWLHEENLSCSEEDVSGDFSAELLPFGISYVSGYSPAQRREVEANVFAAEFLLPATALRAGFLADGQNRTYKEIARNTGLQENLVLNQLAETLLGALSPIESESAANEPDTPQLDGEQLLNTLDASQRKAAEIEHGPVLVSAGPGTGKTRTLVARALVLIKRGVSPENILALTFSNRASNEMWERLGQIDKLTSTRIWIGTFHAFGLELLRRYGARIGLPPSPELLDRVDAIELLERNLDRLNLTEYEYLNDPTLPFGDMLSAISRAKDELASPERYAELARDMAAAAADEETVTAAAKVAEVADVYCVWQAMLKEQGKLDFGDLIFKAVELLEKNPDILQEVREQYSEILVDEYQDINRASAVLVKLIAGEGRGLWAVGDLRQAIYRFRGASPANISQFEQDFPGGRRLSVDVNYRSSPEIVRLVSGAAGRMFGFGDGQGWSAAREGKGRPVMLAEAEDEESQADGIAQLIREFEADGFSLEEQCILCRTNSQADELSGRLEARGIPVLYLGALFERPEIKDMLSLLSLSAEPGAKGMLRVGGMNEYAISAEEKARFIRYATAFDGDTPEAIAAFDSEDPGIALLRDQLGLLAGERDAYSFFSKYLFGVSNYLRGLLMSDDVASAQSRMALFQLLQTARSHAGKIRDEDVHSLRHFLDHVRRLVADGDDSRIRIPSSDGISAARLMTVHAAKGSEFPVVFLPNLAKGKFPTKGRSSKVKLPPGLVPEFEEDDSCEEECLFFVALSRARDRLILIRPVKVKGKVTESTSLLSLIDDATTEGLVERISWTDEAHSSSSEEPFLGVKRDSVSGNSVVHSISELEQYMRCPRQYYYDRVCRLGETDAPSPYLAFHNCLQQSLRWLRSEKAVGRTHGTDEALEYLAQRWEEHGAGSGFYAQKLLTAARESMLNAIRNLDALEGEIVHGEWVVELPSGKIRVQPDMLEKSEDGMLIVERWKAGKARDDDRTDKRLALYRKAAKTEGGAERIEVRTRSLQTDEVTIAPEQPRWEPGRIEKYERALAGISLTEFSAEPKEKRECPRCPFFFICPTEPAD